MTTYATREVCDSARLAPTTGWRRMGRLATVGKGERLVRTGGRGGTESRVRFDGSIDELVSLLGTPEEIVGPTVCPTCGAGVAAPRNGPGCPGCGVATESSGALHLWGLRCRMGYLRAPTARAGSSPA